MGFERELRVAKELVREAGAAALEFHPGKVQAEYKADESPVTAADRASERMILERLTQEFPDDGVLGEEGANRQSRSGRRWIVDPIDGTKDFVRGLPFWSVLLGLEQDGEVIAGAAYVPGQNLLAWASKGGGAWVNGELLQVREQFDPGRAILSFNGFNKPGIQPFTERLLGWTSRFWAVRGVGGSLDAIFLAQGQLDVWIEPNAAPWDLAPLKILVEEAGACFGSFAGENTIYGGNGYACVPGLLPYVRELIC